jgi:hypothetical protein
MKKSTFPETQLRPKISDLPEIVGRIMDGLFALDTDSRFIYEHTSLYNGQVDLQTQPGKGCSIRIIVPFA